MFFSAGPEGDDAADRVVRRDANSHAVAGDHFDSKPSHPSAQLSEHFVTLIALHAVKPPAVNRHDRALYVD